jgi:hypothetical protein
VRCYLVVWYWLGDVIGEMSSGGRLVLILRCLCEGVEDFGYCSKHRNKDASCYRLSGISYIFGFFVKEEGLFFASLF